jgi:hypothetical protein
MAVRKQRFLFFNHLQIPVQGTPDATKFALVCVLILYTG